jgi:hypothetical protein
MARRPRVPIGVFLAIGLLGSPRSFLFAAPDSSGWPQWGGNPQHQGSAAVAGQPLTAVLADILYDPFVAQEAAEGGGQLNVHYAAPLVDEGAVYIERKSGAYVSCQPPRSGQPFPCGADAWALQVWSVEKLQWHGSALTSMWTFSSDWKPEPDERGGLLGWEPVFHPVLAGGSLYVPGSAGTVFQLNRTSGQVVARINPFSSFDPKTYVAGGLAADDVGNVFYNAIRLNPSDPWGKDVLGAWVVKIDTSGHTTAASYASLVSGAPGAASPCESDFQSGVPWPPSSSAVAPTSPCGSQRPALNVVPAIAPDGTVYTVSRAHFNSRYAYLVALRPDSTPLWSASLRGFLDDGCDVLLPPSGTPGGCRAGSTRGVDPATNNRPAARVWDITTSSPVVLPDGAILFGTVTTYNYFRGHLLKFSASGQPLAAYDFGWDSTPAVFTHGSAYSILIKDNHYEVGSYCNDPGVCPPEPGRYDLVSLDPNLLPEWRFSNTNTQSCARQNDGSVTCVLDHPDGFEWCVNQPAVDSRGVLYSNSEDGFLYAIGTDGKLSEKIFLDLARGAAYTPVSIGPDGLLYAQNNGHLFVVGNPFSAPRVAVERPRAPRVKAFR